MPGKGGADIEAELARGAYSPPLVVISGAPDVPSATRTTKDFRVGFLAKPIDLDELVAAVEKAIARDAEAREHLRVL